MSTKNHHHITPYYTTHRSALAHTSLPPYCPSPQGTATHNCTALTRPTLPCSTLHYALPYLPYPANPTLPVTVLHCLVPSCPPHFPNTPPVLYRTTVLHHNALHFTIFHLDVVLTRKAKSKEYLEQ